MMPEVPLADGCCNGPQFVQGFLYPYPWVLYLYTDSRLGHVIHVTKRLITNVMQARTWKWLQTSEWHPAETSRRFTHLSPALISRPQNCGGGFNLLVLGVACHTVKANWHSSVPSIHRQTVTNIVTMKIDTNIAESVGMGMGWPFTAQGLGLIA